MPNKVCSMSIGPTLSGPMIRDSEIEKGQSHYYQS